MPARAAALRASARDRRGLEGPTKPYKQCRTVTGAPAAMRRYVSPECLQGRERATPQAYKAT